MADLERFSQDLAARLAAAQREPSWEPSEATQYMAELEPRRRRFEDIARRLILTLIRPRLEVLAKFFANSKLDSGEHVDRCACWFGYCNRFPASTKVEITAEHDERIERLVLRYELYMMPASIKLDAHDKLGMPLHDVDEQAVANWVEARLLAFMSSYLQLDRGGDDFEDDVVVDPVCRMKISRSSAVALIDYQGRTYYFCASECQRQFVVDPTKYVQSEPV